MSDINRVMLLSALSEAPVSMILDVLNIMASIVVFLGDDEDCCV